MQRTARMRKIPARRCKKGHSEVSVLAFVREEISARVCVGRWKLPSDLLDLFLRPAEYFVHPQN
jgi:hypothetical protein